jgi:hypothetical protein
MDATEVTLVRSSLEAALREAPGRALLEALAVAGWAELAAAEPAVAVAELFEAQGRLLAATPALDLVVAGALGAALEPGTVVAHPTLGAWDTPPAVERPGGGITVDGLVLTGLPAGGRILLPCLGAAGGLVVLEVDAGLLDAGHIGGFDDSLGLVRVRGPVPAAEARPAPEAGVPEAGAPGEGDPTPRWEEVAAAARRAVGHELVGVAQAALDVAARHVTDRIQFGKPIAAFQSVRHRLTEVYVAIASARAALDAAWAVDDPVAPDAAKALAGKAALLAGKHCLQVTGAIGFTWEYELHRRIRRARLLDGLYGGAGPLAARIGAALLSDRRVPRVRSMP